MKPVLVIGAGWSGAVVARQLTNAGLPVEVLERSNVVGGHSRVEHLCGVLYEPNGPHILHTDNRAVVDYLGKHGLVARPYRFQPKTEIETEDGPQLMSWPIQVDEVEDLTDWPTIKAELEDLPDRPSGADFETYAVSLMGRTLYRLFIEGYTRKQWGCEPSELSSSFAPKRIDLRRDGCRDLFRDTYQFFPRRGVNSIIEQILATVSVTCGVDYTAADLFNVDASAIVVTAALDDFTGQPDLLVWRGIESRSRYYPARVDGTRTAAYVINRPSMTVPYTRTVETKHATGQQISGTVVSEEYPGSLAKHYPVDDIYGRNQKMNGLLQAEVCSMLAPVPVFFCGRLATYRYINQDEAIVDAWDCAERVLGCV